jgi:hypothetical protein
VSKRVGRGAVQEVVAQRTVELLPAEKRPAETKAELSADAQSECYLSIYPSSLPLSLSSCCTKHAQTLTSAVEAAPHQAREG